MVTLCRCAQVSRVSLCSQGVCVCAWLYMFVCVFFLCVYMLCIWVKFDSDRLFLPPCSQSWNVLALDGSNWQRIDLFDFQRDIEVSKWGLLSLYTSLFICHCLGSRCRCKYRRLSGLFLLQGRVVENISKRCGGFLRKLSLRGCLGVGDSALRWDNDLVQTLRLVQTLGQWVTGKLSD